MPQDRAAPGYAVKALLARSVLACGCTPHGLRSCPWRRQAPRGCACEAMGYTAAFRDGAVRRFFLATRA